MTREALLIGTASYEHESLRRLRSPAQDVAQLDAVLADPAVGGYDVTTHVDTPAERLSEAIRGFFADRRPDDTLVLYFSGHGIKDAAGELFLAATDTQLDDLDHTALSTDTVNRWVRNCRSRHVLLILDCCYSGAFPRGMFAKAGATVDVHERFTGRGLAIMTATTAIEYAFEGGELADRHDGEPDTSAFTKALIHGLATGEADDNLDQRITLDELYYYVFDLVRAANPRQTPCLWLLGGQGSFVVAHRRPGSTARWRRPAPAREPVVLEPSRRVLALTIPAAVAGGFVSWLGLDGLPGSPLWSVALFGVLLVAAAVPHTVRAWAGRTVLENRGVRVTGLRTRFIPWPSILVVETRYGLFGQGAAVRRGNRLHRLPLVLPAPDRVWFGSRQRWRTGLDKVRVYSVHRGSPTSVVSAGPTGLLTGALPSLVAVIAVLVGIDHPWNWPTVTTTLPDACALLREGSAVFGPTDPQPDNSSADTAGCSTPFAGFGTLRLDYELSRSAPPSAIRRAAARLAGYRLSDGQQGTIFTADKLTHEGYGVEQAPWAKVRLRCGNVVVSVAYDGGGANAMTTFLPAVANEAANRLAAETPGIC
ncbi:caspase, EACC1-associated type [Actinocrispum wychmicini]|uniref:Caspase domain-containing protein n=1 Tax=Actinocrispum wychmicini TaxID=1213861 RepID=A0A4V2S835_9PSEU|nr:caspase family protein [Actinocrispum wychmicini]TCO62360.1 caspase domain-containing protein [Actinocrispum wychmicini]